MTCAGGPPRAVGSGGAGSAAKGDPAAETGYAAVVGLAGERGSATVLLLAVISVALVLAVGAVALGRAADARGVAQAAADLAAIAAAEAAQDGGSPCGVAAQVAAANGARLQGCAQLPGPDVVVSTAVVVSPLAGWTMLATAQARAGPVR